MKWIARLLVVALSAAGAMGAGEPNAVADRAAPQIEAVFVLDTTGSMGGLIQAAKEKIWSIANTMATARPTPHIKIGLVGYRDRGDDYITQRTELDQDLDKVYEKLMRFNASGGGDGPESVNQALHEAVASIQWSPGDAVYRVIFLVGDFPPHMDYDNDIQYPEICKQAALKGIAVNTILCGDNRETFTVWNDIAKKAEGRFFQVEQAGGAILIDTPFDAEMAEWSRKLDDTRLYWGEAAEQRRMKERTDKSGLLYDLAPASAVAQRALFNSSVAGKTNFRGRQELLGDLSDGRVDLETLKPDELPEEIKALTPAERQDYIVKKQAQREEAVKAIRALSEQRQAYIQKKMAEQKLDTKASLEYRLFECIRDQGGKKGLRFAGPDPSM